MYPEKKNLVIFKLSTPSGNYAYDSIWVKTPTLPVRLPDIDIVKIDPAKMEPGMHLSELNIGGANALWTTPFIFDNDSVIRWFIDLSFTGGWTAPFERLRNGSFLFGHGNNIYEFDILGKEINRLTIPGNRVHHDLIEKPDTTGARLI